MAERFLDSERVLLLGERLLEHSEEDKRSENSEMQINGNRSGEITSSRNVFTRIPEDTC